jgi:hypothetical protein
MAHFDSFSSPEVRRESGGEAKPFKFDIEATLDAGYVYGGGGPGYICGLAKTPGVPFTDG